MTCCEPQNGAQTNFIRFLLLIYVNPQDVDVYTEFCGKSQQATLHFVVDKGKFKCFSDFRDNKILRMCKIIIPHCGVMSILFSTYIFTGETA